MFDATFGRAELFGLLPIKSERVLRSTSAARAAAGGDIDIQSITGLWNQAVIKMQQQSRQGSRRENMKITLPQFLAASSGGRIRVVVTDVFTFSALASVIAPSSSMFEDCRLTLCISCSDSMAQESGVDIAAFDCDSDSCVFVRCES
jgi:hypothetical protein